MTNPRDSPMTNGSVEVITSVQLRRRWPRAEKERIVAAALEPGAVAFEIARAAGIHTSQLFRWRQQLCERAQIPAALVIAVVIQRIIPSVETVVLVRRSFIMLFRWLDTQFQLVSTRRMTRTIKGDFCGSKQRHRALGNNRILALHRASDNLSTRINDNAIPR